MFEAYVSKVLNLYGNVVLDRDLLLVHTIEEIEHFLELEVNKKCKVKLVNKTLIGELVNEKSKVERYDIRRHVNF